MGTFLRHQESTVRYGKHQMGWMWGFLHFFDFHHHLHVRKMLTDRKHEGTKDVNLKQNVPQLGEEDELLLNGADMAMEDKANAKIKSSASSRIRNLISKKMSKKRDKKKKTTPLATKLQRTLSIHYLECNDYVVSDEMSSDSEASTVESNSCETESCASSGHATPMWQDFDKARQFELGNQFLANQVVLTEKLAKLKPSNSDTKGQSGDVALYGSKDFSDMLDLFNTNQELFHQISQDPNSVFANHLPGKHASSSEMVLTKSGSFPGTALSGKKRGGLSRFQREGEGGDSSNSRESQPDNTASASSANDKSLQQARTQLSVLKPDHAVMNSSGTNSNLEFLLASPRGLNNQKDAVTVSSRFNGLKQRIQDIIQENKKEQQRISMDGLLHKIPYGHKVSENVKDEKHNLWDGLAREKSVFANSKHYSRSFRRSRSLTESLESYSRLLESVSFRESTRLPEELRLIQADPVKREKKNPRTLERIHSNPEYGSFLQMKGLLTGDGAVNLVDSIVSEEEYCKETSMLSTYTLAGETIGEGLEETATLNELDQNQNQINKDLDDLEEAADIHTSVEHVLGVNDGDIADGISEKEMLVNALDQSSEPDGIYDLKEEKSVYSFIHEQEVTNKEEPCNNQIKPCSISILNSCFEEQPVSPANCSAIEELSTGGILRDEADVIATDTIKAPWQSAVADVDAFNVQVNQKDDAEFKYVRDLLNKSELSGESLPREWYSPYPEVHHSLLHKDTECSNHDSNIATDDPDMSLDHQLRFNLINEVLADIYVRSFSYWPGFMHFNSRTRPMPAGYHVLEEVWGNISWHLDSQKHTCQNLDTIIARDFTTNDGWMNLRWDAECVALELEALLFDDLLHEAMLDFNGLLISP